MSAPDLEHFQKQNLQFDNRRATWKNWFSLSHIWLSKSSYDLVLKSFLTRSFFRSEEDLIKVLRILSFAKSCCDFPETHVYDIFPQSFMKFTHVEGQTNFRIFSKFAPVQRKNVVPSSEMSHGLRTFSLYRST